jgi:hypothetical protein
VEQAVAALAQTGHALADDQSRALEEGHCGLTPRSGGAVDTRSSLAGMYAFAEFDQRLEQAVLRRVNIVVGPHNFE